MIFQILIDVGFAGSIVAMVQFSKYCRLLNKRWTLDPETAERYQARAQRWLAAAGCMMGTAILLMFLGTIIS